MRFRPSLRQFCLIAAGALALYLLVAPYLESAPLRHSLLDALDHAATIKVVEHSDPQSFRERTPDGQEKIYASVILNPDQISALRHCLWLAENDQGHWILKCIYAEHHYVQIISKDGKSQTLGICFECGQFRVSENPDDPWQYYQLGIMSSLWKGSLSRFISSLGMHPNGPWPLPQK